MKEGWSLTSYVAECVFKHGAGATTPSPLLSEEGNTLGEFIHSFMDRQFA